MTNTKRITYRVTLPDGTNAAKIGAGTHIRPTGYVYQHSGAWHVAAIDEANCDRLAHFTPCPAAVCVGGVRHD